MTPANQPDHRKLEQTNRMRGIKLCPPPPPSGNQRLEDVVPGYKELVAKESSIREKAHFKVPRRVAGLLLRPMTMEDYLLLGAANSPYIFNRAPTLLEQSTFLWIMSPSFLIWSRMVRASVFLGVPNFARFAVSVRQFFHSRQIRKCSQAELNVGLLRYVSDTFIDCPGGSGKYQKSYYTFFTSYVDMFASEYGWTEKIVRRLSLNEVFQFQKVISMRHGQSPWNASDQAIQAWYKQQAEDLKKAKTN